MGEVKELAGNKKFNSGMVRKRLFFMPMQIPISRPVQYGNRLKALKDELENNASSAPFSNRAGIVEWIRDLTFVPLREGDHLCRRISEYPYADWHADKLIWREPTEIRWQVILRCEMAADFCHGDGRDRIGFPWAQPKKNVLERLLIQHWRVGALQWALEKYGSNEQKRRMRLEREGNWVLYRQPGTIPRDN